jgi:hypothetical protein
VLDAAMKPITKVYVKTFAKFKSGETQYYKDGYTDIRGTFDFASLNSTELNQIEKFSILIVSEKHGTPCYIAPIVYHYLCVCLIS